MSLHELIVKMSVWNITTVNKYTGTCTFVSCYWRKIEKFILKKKYLILIPEMLTDIYNFIYTSKIVQDLKQKLSVNFKTFFLLMNFWLCCSNEDLSSHHQNRLKSCPLDFMMSIHVWTSLLSYAGEPVCRQFNTDTILQISAAAALYGNLACFVLHWRFSN